jgi:hypothetical protein
VPTRWDEFQENIRALEESDDLAHLGACAALTDAVNTAADAFGLAAELQLAEDAASRYDRRVHGKKTRNTIVLDHSRAAEQHLEAGQMALVNGEPDQARLELAASVQRFEAAIALLPEQQA